MQGDTQAAKAWRQRQRERLVASRQAISPALRESWQQHVISQLLNYLSELHPGTVGFYLPIHGELDCRPLVTTLIQQGWQAAVPVMQQGVKTLTFCQWTPQTEMIAGIWQIPVPKHQVVLRPDILLIPLVGYDHDGYRLGYGGGYYDRTLAQYSVKPLTIGVGLNQGHIDTIYPHQFDIPMDLIVTENQLLIFS